MNIIKNIGWFLFDIMIWIGKFFGYLMRKIIKFITIFFSSENLSKNKIKIITWFIILLVILFVVRYISQNYKIIFISKDEKKQSVSEKTYLNNLKKVETGQIEPKLKNTSNGSVNQSRPVSFRGNVKAVETDSIIIMTDREEEKKIMLNEKTRMTPRDNKLEVGQSVMVSARQENEEIVAVVVSIRPASRANLDVQR